MALRRFQILIVLAMIGWPTLALSAGFPRAECTLNTDKSSMRVLGVSTGGKAYSCSAECRLKISGQRAFDLFKCNFSLGANTNETVVCERPGSGRGHYTEVSSSKFTCIPQ